MESEYLSTMQKKVDDIEKRAKEARERARMAIKEAEELDKAAEAYRRALAFEQGKQGVVEPLDKKEQPPVGPDGAIESNGSFNVAGFVRDAVLRSSGIKVRDIREALKKQGQNPTANYVYAILARAKESGIIRKEGDKYYSAEDK